MAVRTKQLGIGRLLVGAGGIYTGPSGETTILKTLCFYNEQVLQQALALSIRPAGDPTVDHWFATFTLAASTATRLDTWLVLMPGDVVRLNQNLVGPIAWSLHGTQLEGVAD